MPEMNETDVKLITALREVVAERGEDFVYSEEWRVDGMCVYTNDGRASCILGAVYEKVEGEVYSGEYMGGFTFLLRHYPELTSDVRYAISKAQVQQDRYYPWGNALQTVEGLLRQFNMTMPEGKK